MTNFKKQLISAAAAGAMLLNIASPALAATTITISGNGSDSKNTADIEMENKTEVNQTNVADIENKVDVNSDTGDNDANDNVGGDVEIKTGDANATVDVKNTVNTNAAQTDCCEAGGDTTVQISGNGDDSRNNVWLDRENKVDVDQENYAEIENDVDVDADTGDNDAEDNVGGKVSIKTGSATTNVTLDTTANANMARVGSASTNGGSISAIISGNGDSDNEIDLEFEDKVYLDQVNNMDLENDVDVDSDTGDNDAEDNVGGDVVIETGDADTDVTVDNEVNFNAADVNCGCLLDDLMAKVSGNGDNSDNEIEVELEGKTDVDQFNFCGVESNGPSIESFYGRSECENDVDVDSDTGDNEAEDNVGSVGDDPSIKTGDADTEVNVETEGNANFFGVEFDFDLEDIFDNLLG